mmetsp:Transcript_60351/g.155528  ORF Transcript_60351/g.155528 Transcript_60351/m.155528 type:complete len:790 (-) Transcript_60351:21-2390(-)
MPAPPSGSAISSCVPRVSLAWTAPILCFAAGIAAPQAFWVASGFAAALELLLWLCQQSKDLRRSLGGITRVVPFPMRLGILWALQLWIYNVIDGAASAPGTQARGDIGELRGASSSAGLASEGANAVPHAAALADTANAAGHGPMLPPAHQPLTATDDGAGVSPEPKAALADVGGVGAVGADAWGTDQFGDPFSVDADIKSLAWDPKTISVVLPCAEERDYAFKTVKAVFDNTPADVLKEIIVVDDGSNPPLAETHLGPDVQKKYNLRVLRHEQTVGLIGAKKTGGDAMLGDIGAFFDCHVAPQPGWYKDFLKLIGENWRRMVVPQITALDINTWTQQGFGGGMAKCYLTWDADFKWFDSEDMYVAVISGGLLGMSRRWWFETGGYDTKMLGWGGENLDQSLRMWLCGGEIVACPNSQVAHMWRTGDRRTSARYKHVGDSGVNRARAVYAWYGDFADKLLHYPSFNRRNGGSGPWYGDLSNIIAIKDRLKCRPFAWFLRRFKSIYEDAGLIPGEVFMLKEESTGKCLKFEGSAGTAGGGVGQAGLYHCGDKDDHQFWWHLGNKSPRKGGACCSGLHAWNTDQCLQDISRGKFRTGVCDVSGRNPSQYWAISSFAGELKQGDKCVGTPGGTMQSKPCISLRSSGSRWQKVGAYVPLETDVYRRTRTDHPELFTRLDMELAKIPGSKSPCEKAPGGCFKLFVEDEKMRCIDEGSELTVDPDACADYFYKKGELHPALDPGHCLDRWNDHSIETWGITTCHGGDNQQFKKKSNMYCDMENDCLTFRGSYGAP